MRIAADHLFTGTSQTRPGRIVIEKGRIVDLLDPGESDLNLGEAMICSGLVNAHVHLDLSTQSQREFVADDFDAWLRGIVDLRRSMGPEGMTEAAAQGIEKCLSGGTTAVFDIDPSGHALSPLAESDLKRVVFREQIALAGSIDDLGPLNLFFDEKCHPNRELRALSPHSPYTVSTAAMDQLIDLCLARGIPWAIHVAEDVWEEELLTSGTGPGAEFLRKFDADPQSFVRGSGFIRSLAATGKLSASCLVIHGNHCTGEELDDMAAAGSSLVWCPSSHESFRRPPHPVAAALSRGVNVMLGTDGEISAGHLSMLKELRKARQAASELTAQELWSMVTVNPRSWLSRCGHGSLLGSGRLEVGDPADLIAVSIPDHTLPPMESALQGSVLACWIDGRVINSSAPADRRPLPSEKEKM